MARLSRLVAIAGWTLLGAVALAGLGVSALAGYGVWSAPGAAAAGLLGQELDRLIAGRLRLDAVVVLPRGAVELRGLRLHDPDGHLVASAPRARIFADLTRLPRGEVGLTVEVESPSVVLATGPDGGLSLARALAPARPGPAPAAAGPARTAWRIRLERLTARGGLVRWERQDGRAGAELTAVDLDAEGAYGEGDASLAVRGRAQATAPVPGPLAVAVAARLRGDRLELPVVDVALDATRLQALGEGDVRTRAFRAAVTRLGIGAADARRLAPAAAPAADVAASGYAESDGAIVTAALEVPPAGEPPTAGSARAAIALRIGGGRAGMGLDVALAAFDPSRLLAQAPAGRVDLTARGAAAGRGLADGRGRVALELAPSQVRGVALGPVALVASGERGRLDVARLEARLPGLAVSGSGRWSERGPVGGELAVDAGDLGALGRALAALGLDLPPLGGRLRAHATLAGRGEAPTVEAALDAAAVSAGAVRAEAVAVAVDAAGPLAAARLRLTGHAARAVVDGVEARALELSATLADAEATVSATGSVPSLGPDPVALEAAAHLAADRRRAEVRKLAIRWPGVRLALVRPAAVVFSPPSVDRLELAEGPRSIALSGGVGARDALDLRLEVLRLDLARLPRGLVPPELGAAGELSLDARASGTVRAPRVDAHATIVDGAVRGLSGLQAKGDLRWDGSRRLAGEVTVRRREGGVAEVRCDLPLPLASAPARERVSLELSASAWPLEALRQAAALAAPVRGTLGGRAALSGTVEAPRLEARVAIDDAAARDLAPLAAVVEADGAGGTLRIGIATRLADAPLATADVRVPLDPTALLRRPGPTVRALSSAPLGGALAIPGLDLSRLAGKVGLPGELAGTLSGGATLGGTPAAPRGRGEVTVSGAAVAGYREIAARAELLAEGERTALVVRGAIGGAEALRGECALGLPVERLGDRDARRAARLTIEATVPPVTLARGTGPPPPLAGTISAHVAATGTVTRPEARLELDGKGVEIRGRPLGDLTAAVRLEAPTARGELSLRPATGGSLRAEATLSAPRGLDDTAALRGAPATVRVSSDALDLGFLPQVLPGLFRRASGRLTLDLAASAPLVDLRPRGAVRLEGGRLDIVDLGDWTGIELAASLGDRSIEVSRLEARRRGGHLSGKLAVHELGTPRAKVDGRLTLQALTIGWEGSELATLDLPAALEGTVTDDVLDATVTLEGGTIRLPRRASGNLQSVVDRPDIVDAEAAARRGSSVRAAAPARPFTVRCRVVVPGRLFVKGERPALNVELKGDSTWQLVGTELGATGYVEVVRGTVEPIAGRVFHLERGRVTFPGGPASAAQLDLVARYDNPTAVVTVVVGGSAVKPTLQFSSRPPLDDQTIALLIATGRTEMNLNTSGVAPMTTQEAGAAMASAAVNAAFTGLVADKLPVDQISVDSSRVRAGKYVTQKLFVGYAYRFDAKPEQGENVNEVKAEYQLAPSWNFEVRYGDAQSGDASLIWSKDY